MSKRCPASPSSVCADETVVRGIYSPSLFEDGKITPAAVKIEELLPKNGHVDECGDSSGVSVFRIDFVGGIDQAEAELRTLIDRPMKDGTLRKAVGFAAMKAKEITNVGDGPLVLIDDGKVDLSCHAVIRAPEGKERAALRRARDNLIILMNKGLCRLSGATTSQTTAQG
jgi:hypothetical protein